MSTIYFAQTEQKSERISKKCFFKRKYVLMECRSWAQKTLRPSSAKYRRKKFLKLNRQERSYFCCFYHRNEVSFVFWRLEVLFSFYQLSYCYQLLSHEFLFSCKYCSYFPCSVRKRKKRKRVACRQWEFSAFKHPTNGSLCYTSAAKTCKYKK